MPRIGRYELDERIGVGGMAEVWRAGAFAADGTRTTVVIKKILPSYSDDPDFRQMFVDETRIAAQLDHPNIVKLLDLGRMDGQLFIAFELVDGPDLERLLDRARERGKPLPPPVAVQIVIAVLAALAHAHSRRRGDGAPLEIVHRDVTPANVIVSRDGLVKLADFGIAKARHRSTRTRVGIVKGHSLYMPPEQMEAQIVDARGDVYSAGMLLRMLLAGRHPLDDLTLEKALEALKTGALPKPTSFAASLPPELDFLAEKATALAPADRYPNAAAFRDALTTLAKSQGWAIDDPKALAERVRDLFPPSAPSASPAPAPAARRMTSGFFRMDAAPIPADEGSVFSSIDWPAPPPLVPPPPPPASVPVPVRLPLATPTERTNKRDDTSELRKAPPGPPPPVRMLALGTFLAHRQAVSALVALPDGRGVLSASLDGTVKVWDLEQRLEQRRVTMHRAAVTALDLTPDGRFVLSGSRDRTVALWGLDDGEEKARLSGHGGWVFGAAISPDGTRALTAAFDRTIKLWDLSAGKELETLAGHGDAASAVTFLDATRALSASYDATLRLWDLERGTEIAVLSGAKENLRALAVSDDRRWALAGGADTQVHVWDLADRRRVASFTGHAEPVVSVLFAAGGARALSASYDGTVRLWSLPDGKELHRLDSGAPVLAAALMPGGKHVVTGGADGTIGVWSIQI